MTTFLQSFSRQAVNAYCGGTGATQSAAQRDEAEYQAVYALTGVLLGGGVVVALAGLAHAFH